MSEIPYGYCHCGCGQKTKIVKKTDTRYGQVKGEPMRYIHRHHADGAVEPIVRFWSKVNKNGSIQSHCPELGACWEWQGRINVRGYGAFSIKGKTVQAHRFSWQLVNGAIPGDLWVLHKCDNRLCLNPDHLFLGTNSDNIRDAIAKGRVVIPTPRKFHSDKTAFKRGEEVNLAKLTRVKVIEIRKLYRNGMNMDMIAKSFNVSISTICRVINFKTWAHVTDE